MLFERGKGFSGVSRLPSYAVAHSTSVPPISCTRSLTSEGLRLLDFSDSPEWTLMAVCLSGLRPSAWVAATRLSGVMIGVKNTFRCGLRVGAVFQSFQSRGFELHLDPP